MASTDERRSSATTKQGLIKKPFTLPGLVKEASPVEQLPFSDGASSPVGLLNRATHPEVTYPLSDPLTPTTEALPAPEPGESITLPAVTRHLPEYSNVTRPLSVPTNVLPYLKSNTTTSLRQPVVIRGTGKKSTGLPRPPQGRRWVVQIAVTSLVLLITMTTLLTVVPIDNEGTHILNPFQSISNLVQINGGNPSLIAQQAATATAVTKQDGYDPGSNGAPLPGNASGDSFPYGQCTYWADSLYHQMTGHYVPWRGDAYAWAYGASQYGWVVSSRPHVPSIIVLGPGVQGASWLGHVAVVIGINSDGSVHTSNMNWWAGGGGWGRVSDWDFYPGPDVSFVWYAG